MFFVKPTVKKIISIPKLEELLRTECVVQLHYNFSKRFLLCKGF